MDNVGLVARCMMNTGFRKLRVTPLRSLGPKAFVTAVHARRILEEARFFSSLEEAVADLDVVLAATAKRRKNFCLLSLEEAVSAVFAFPRRTRIGLLFGNERTGLTSEEMRRSNLRFTIVQSAIQPSYNLSSAVLLALYSLFSVSFSGSPATRREKPAPRCAQEECLRLIIGKLERRGFVHGTNRRRVTDMIHDLFGRAALTDRDIRLLLAIFSKGLD